MKLILPIRLRAALLAAFALSACAHAFGDDIWSVAITDLTATRIIREYQEISICGILSGNAITLTSGHQLELTLNDNLRLSSNSGAAIHNVNGSIIIRNNNSGSFLISQNGQAIFNDGGGVYILQNKASTIVFEQCGVDDDRDGGAIFNTGTIEINGNNNVSFSKNFAGYPSSSTVSSHSDGGAIYNTGTITINDNKDISFSGNYTTYHSSSGSIGTHSHGGAIFNSGSFSMCDNRNITFSGNYTTAPVSGILQSGGAIYNGADSEFAMSRNGDISFNGNYGAIDGGAIYNQGTFTMNDNKNITFAYNRAQGVTVYGGAIETSGTFTMNGNKSIAFSGNYSDGVNPYGGAISNGGTFEMNANGDISFTDNHLWRSYLDCGSTYGGAIYNIGNFEMNGNGNITFSGNYVAPVTGYGYGGAIYNKGKLAMIGNGDITFSGNYAIDSDDSSTTTYGGAIYSNGTTAATLTIADNGNVLFEKNCERWSTGCRLRSIYSDSEANIYLAAKTGTSITFRDSVYSSGNCRLNEYYTDDGSRVTTSGDIIFTGESTVTDLTEIKGRAPSEYEIKESRTSTFSRNLTIGAGRLIVQDDAVLEASNLSVSMGAKLLLNQGTLQGRVSIMGNCSEIELARANSMTGTLSLYASSPYLPSVLSLTLSDDLVDAPLLALEGKLQQYQYLKLNVNGSLSKSGRYALISTSGFDKEYWSSSYVKSDGVRFDDLE